MKYVLAFATSFAAVLLVAAILRAAVLSRDSAPADLPQNSQSSAHQHEAPANQPAPKPENHAQHTPPLEKPAEVAALGNESDPVSGAKLEGTPVLLEHKHWQIGFASEDTRKRFEKNPMRYYAKLSLEPTTDGRLLQVDGSRYERALAADCPIMGGEIDPEGEVFILHRGFKIHFCCWSGCADEFLANAAKHYAHYGLIERDGKLVRK
ncbi:MAG TPA: hypothetical protein PLF37_12290 [Planctomycetota bacterium]|nr:hypothetical protein [Planctomycetota bacterium]